MWQRTLALLIGLGLSLTEYLPVWPLYASLVAGFIGLIYWQRAKLCLWLLAGVISGWGQGLYLNQLVLPAATETVQLQIKLLQPQQRYPWGQTWLAQVNRLNGHTLLWQPQFKIWLSLPLSVSAQVAETWQVSGQLKPLRTLANFDDLNLDSWLLSQGIRARLQAQANTSQPLTGPTGLDHWREQLNQFLLRYQTELPRTRLIPAIVMGQDQHLLAEDWLRWRTSGTLHLLVVSGGHLSALALWFGYAGRYLWARSRRASLIYPAPLVGLVSGLIAAGVFVLVVGNQVALWRAWLMLLFATSLSLSRRHWQPWAVWNLSLRLIALVSPLSLLLPGTWLSFIAVALIFMALEQGRAWFRVQWFLFVGLTPLLAFWFHQVYSYSLLVNLVAIPLIGFGLLPIAAVWLLTGWLHTDWARLLAQLCEWLLTSLEWLQNTANALPAATWPVSAQVWLLFWLGLTAAMALIPRTLCGRALTLANLMVSFWLLSRQPWLVPPLRITMLDVGQGLAVLVETPTAVLLYDAGPANKAGRSIAAASLRSLGWSHLERVLLSHNQQDHVGGLAALKQEITIGSVWANDYPDAAACYRGAEWHWSEVQFRVLFPPLGSQLLPNDGSCTLLVETGTFKLLLTGDLTSASERQLLRLEPNLTASLLQLGHHGSRYSSSYPWLRQLQPQMAWAGTGWRNHYGFPHPATLARLRSLAIPVADTATWGALRLELDSQQNWHVTRARSTQVNWLQRLSHGAAE